MSTTIDKLQIEIESTSGNAAKGIDELAKSLSALKKSGTISVAVKNLNNLSDALHRLPNVHPASNALRTLANSIEKLKGVGSISGTVTSLNKLPSVLKSLDNINLDKVAPRIREVAEALSPLSSVRAGGIGTMVNSLKKLDDVTKSLDDETIARFAAKVQTLTQKLGPLSEKMTTIKAGFNAINSAARSTTVNIDKLGDQVNITTLNFANLVTSIQGVVAAIQPLIQLLITSITAAMEWDGIKYRFGNAFGAQADEYYEKITKISEALRINKQDFMGYSSLATSMLTGFGVAESDAREMGVGYTELAYDIWAAYNDIYKTLDGADGAMAAVRSAISGEVEPIRRAGFTIVDSQLAITAANHGLAYSTTEATEAQKSYLRYLTLIDQAQTNGIIGTYAREMDTAEGMMRTFSQQLKSLAQAFGSLFLPILVKVMPYLQAFVELLEDGVRWVAALFGVEIQDIGDTWHDYSSGIKDAASNTDGVTDSLKDATKAAKELKNATIGIDELNVISPNSASSGSAGAGGSGAGGAGGGYPGLDVGSLWDESIFDGLQQDVDKIKEKMEGWMPVIATVAAGLAGLRLVKLLDDINLIEGTKLFKGKIKGLAGFTTAFAQLAKEGGIIAALAAAFPKMANGISKVIKFFPTFFGNMGAFFALAKEGGILQALAAAFPKIANGLTKITSKAGPVGLIITAIITAIVFLIEKWDEMKKVAADFFDDNIAPKFEEIRKHIDKLKESLEPLKPVFEWIGEAIRWLGDAFNWLVTVVGGVVVALTAGGLAGAFNAIVSVIEGFVQWLSGVVQIIRGIIELVVGIFTGDGEKIVEAWRKIWAGVKDVFAGLYDMTIGPIVEFVKGVIDWFVKMWDELVGHSIVPDTINAIVDWFTSLPSKIFSSIEKFATGIVDKFKGMWSKLVSWWNGKSKLSTYTPSIGSIKDKLSSAWTTAKNWWSKSKSALSKYTPSIGSIKDKLSSAWTTAKNWWNKSKGSMSYTPTIGDIKSKLSSAWNTAKKWWNSNVKLSIPSLSFKVTYTKSGLNLAQKAIVKALDLSGWPKLSFAANGGIFDQGSLIWAGERGPEVMATAAGGKTGVMNVQQMQDAVYEGVYAAMSAAMRGSESGGEQSINIYLDGRQITAAVEKRQRERGASIMGNEVYAY